MSMTTSITIVWALALILPFAVAIPMMLKARSALRIADGRFLLAFSGLLGAMAAANGVVEPEEVAAVEGYLSRMGLTRAERALCFGNFVLASRLKRDAHGYAKELAGQFGRACCTLLYALVWKVASADGSVDADEDRLLREIAADFGFGNEVYAWFKAGEAPVLNKGELRAEGVPPSLMHLVK